MFLFVVNNFIVWFFVFWVFGYENVDLLVDSLKKVRERGLGVYVWIFIMNFGYIYF